MYCLIFNKALNKIFQWLFSLNSKVSIHKIVFKNAVCKMSICLCLSDLWRWWPAVIARGREIPNAYSALQQRKCSWIKIGLKSTFTVKYEYIKGVDNDILHQPFMHIIWPDIKISHSFCLLSGNNIPFYTAEHTLLTWIVIKTRLRRCQES